MQLRIFDAVPISVVGVDAHIDPAGCTAFTEILGEFVTSHWADRVVGPYVKALLSPYLRSGGRLCPPAGYIGFTDIFGETATSQRADVGIGPYRTPANPYFLASFERKAFLQQILNRSYSQIWCTITGGAYQIARRVSTCVRNICKSDSCLNRTAGRTPRPQAPLFFPFFSSKTEKNGPPEARRTASLGLPGIYGAGKTSPLSCASVGMTRGSVGL